MLKKIDEQKLSLDLQKIRREERNKQAKFKKQKEQQQQRIKVEQKNIALNNLEIFSAQIQEDEEKEAPQPQEKNQSSTRNKLRELRRNAQNEAKGAIKKRLKEKTALAAAKVAKKATFAAGRSAFFFIFTYGFPFILGCMGVIIISTFIVIIAYAFFNPCDAITKSLGFGNFLCGVK